jgi:hypothetical protein
MDIQHCCHRLDVALIRYISSIKTYFMDWNTLKKFKNQYHLARKAAEHISKDKFSLKMKFDKKEGIRTTLDIPPEGHLARFVACIRPFADPSSPLHFRKIGQLVKESDAPGLKVNKKTIDHFFEKVERGPINIKTDIGVFNALEIFLVYSKGEFFSDQSEEAKIIAQFKKDPLLNQLILYQFYNYSYEVYKACSYLYGLIRQLERLFPDEAIKDQEKQEAFCCIYCLDRNGSFTSHEHVYPESFGNTEIILAPGYVCDLCNNEILSPLDDYLVNHDIFSFLKVFFMDYNPKTGKFPKAKYQNITIEKTRPRDLQIVKQSGKENSLRVEKKENGTFKIKIKTIGRIPFDPVKLARSLYKIALGIICWQHGLDMALNERFNTAREFIIGKRTDFPNNLLIATSCTPAPLVEGHFGISKVGTLFMMNLFAVVLVFNLEKNPHIMMNEYFEAFNFQCFSLTDHKNI